MNAENGRISLSQDEPPNWLFNTSGQSLNNIHTSNIKWTEQDVFLYLGICVHIYI